MEDALIFTVAVGAVSVPKPTPNTAYMKAVSS